MGELIGTTTIEKAGLLSPDLFKVYPHFVNAYDSVYKIADNVTDWYRAPIAVLCNDSADTCMDFLSFIVVMPLYLQNIDLYHFLVNVIDYPVMGGNVSRPCNIPTAP